MSCPNQKPKMCPRCSLAAQWDSGAKSGISAKTPQHESRLQARAMEQHRRQEHQADQKHEKSRIDGVHRGGEAGVAKGLADAVEQQADAAPLVGEVPVDLLHPRGQRVKAHRGSHRRAVQRVGPALLIMRQKECANQGQPMPKEHGDGHVGGGEEDPRQIPALAVDLRVEQDQEQKRKTARRWPSCR